ncbi:MULTISPECIES: hypothetical protein [unclassified Micromonospora]|uniref:hypothetical protein n=1 Tax=unclassified Micromonospora TaxID=2617518 RepID=UPI001C2415E9|nr:MULTISPECIES: hypothetical protein [unclassified Micromonospora]MBU8857657.1 hypothetical protein [Micromonospora sp. WMMB482]MDM4783286.1 hypothetical protein [Micromonospora sp. b486]
MSAALPSDTYAPTLVHQTHGGSPTVEFEGEDHRRRTFDFAECPLPGWHSVLAQVLAQRVGASGQLRTSSSSLAAWNNLRKFLRFLAALADPPQRPSELTVAHVNAFTAGETNRLGTVYGATTADHVWRLLRLQPAAGIVDETAINALRIRSAGTPTDNTPGYSDRELASVLHAARGDTVKLLARLHVNAAEEMLQRFQTNAERLTNAERMEGLRLSEMAALGLAAPDGQGRNGFFQRQRLAEPLFVTRRDVAALLVLLVAVTGRNVETIKELPAQHRLLDGNAVEVRLTKRRSGDGKWFQTATWEIGPPGRELHHPGGLYLLLHQMMARGRALSADPSSFWAVWRNLRRGRNATANEISNPFAAALAAGIEVRQWGIDHHGLRGDDEQPLAVTFKRLRTSVEVRRTRTLGGHLPSAARSNTAAVLFRNYLRADPVAREWAQEVTGEAIGAAERAALDAHRQSLARPSAPAVAQEPSTHRTSAASQEGPWSDCKDPAEHPATGRICRASFLDCFHCGNCLIDRSHLPRLVALLAELDQRRQLMTEEQWWARYGPAWAAIRTDVLPRFTPAEVARARRTPVPPAMLDLTDEPWERP